MEEQQIDKSKTPWGIIAVVAAGAIAALYFLSKKAIAEPPILPGDVPFRGDYSLGFWKWTILRNPTWAKATFDKARISKTDARAQLDEDARRKGSIAVGIDYSPFKLLVDAKIAADQSSDQSSVKFDRAVASVIEPEFVKAVKLYNRIPRLNTENVAVIKNNVNNPLDGVIL